MSTDGLRTGGDAAVATSWHRTSLLPRRAVSQEVNEMRPDSGTDNVLRLRDGRLLGYAEYGDPDGKPLFYFHGSPGSRLAAEFTD